jgi:hypothetical protein
MGMRRTATPRIGNNQRGVNMGSFLLKKVKDESSGYQVYGEAMGKATDSARLSPPLPFLCQHYPGSGPDSTRGGRRTTTWGIKTSITHSLESCQRTSIWTILYPWRILGKESIAGMTGVRGRGERFYGNGT